MWQLSEGDRVFLPVSTFRSGGGGGSNWLVTNFAVRLARGISDLNTLYDALELSVEYIYLGNLSNYEVQ